MRRTRLAGFGDGDAGSGSYDPGDPAGNVLAPSPDVSAGSIADLVAANDARNAALTNVDPVTALQARFSASVPKGAGLPLAIAGVGLLALILLPDNGGGRRR